MDEQRMKENGVPLLHHEVHSGVVFVIVLDSVEHDVNSSLPLGIVVWLQRAFVCAGEHDQTAVVAIDVFHGRPSANDVVAGPEGEVVQVLMQGVAGRLLA